MQDMFFKLIEMSAMGSVVILITILMRFVLRNRSKRYIMILWAVVAIRLLVPFGIESRLSLFNLIPDGTVALVAQADEPATEEFVHSVDNTQFERIEFVAGGDVASNDAAGNYAASNDAAGNDVTGDVVTSDEPLTTGEQGSNQRTIREVATEPLHEPSSEVVNNPEVLIVKHATSVADSKSSLDRWTVLVAIWYGVAMAILWYCAFRYVLLKRSLKGATEVMKNVYESSSVETPFVFGFLVPKIYLPDTLARSEREYILMHEKTHIRNGDWICKILGMVVVALHWFNPLVWIAYALYEQDVEMRCDESTIRNLTADVKKAYTMSLVSYAKKNSSRRYLVTSLGFSENNFGKSEVKNRVKNIVNYKKGTRITSVILVTILLALASACALNKTSILPENEVDESSGATTSVAEASSEDESSGGTTETSTYVLKVDEAISETTENTNFTLLRAKAEELHSEDESLRFGYYWSLVEENFVMLVGNNDAGYETYSVEDGEIQSDIYLNEGGVAETMTISYDQFIDLPAFYDFQLLSLHQDNLDNPNFSNVPEDGNYSGSVIGFSADGRYLYATLGQVATLDLSTEEVSELSVGDDVTLMGESYKVCRIDEDQDERNARNLKIQLCKPECYPNADIDDIQYSIVLYLNDIGEAYDYTIIDFWGRTGIINPTLVRVPIAEDCTIEAWESVIINGENVYQLVSENGNDLNEYLSSLTTTGRAIRYSEGGFGFDRFEYMNTGTDWSNGVPIPLVIENGEVTYMNMYINVPSHS